MTQLRPYQQQLVDDNLAAWAAGHRNVLCQLATGGGKCLGRGTPILMHDGRIKAVEDVAVGDLLMGPDSQPRRVLSTCRGEEELWRVTPVKGDPYVVNASHILSTKVTGSYRVVNVNVVDFARSNKTFRHTHKGWRTGVDFPSSGALDPDLPPWLLGEWLGDGSSNGPSFTTADAEVVAELDAYATARGLVVRREEMPGNKASVYFVNSGTRRGPHGRSLLLNALRRHDLLHNKHIPHAYLTASRADRMELLAGLLDSDGYLHRNGFDVVFVNERLARGMAFLARSLGFACYVAKCRKGCQGGFVGDYWRLSISGDGLDQLPLRIPRLRPAPRRQKKNALVTGISVEPIGPGEYFGFEIDGDHLFMLGDFTVTHNTVVIGEHVKREPGLSVLIAHRQELVGQLALQMAREGVYHDVQAPASVRRDIVSAQMELYGRSYLASGAHVQVAGVDTLARRGAPSWAAAARLVVVDEAHHVTAANKWGQAVGLFPNARGLFPTATPARADGLGLGRHADGLADVMTHGPTQRWLIDQGYLSQYRLVCPPESIHTEIAVSASTGDFSQPAVRKAAHESSIVGDGIAHYLRWTPGKLCIAYTVDVESAVDAASRFRAEGVAAEVISAKTPTSLRAHLMRQFREGKLRVLVNCDTLSEGVDVPGVEVVLDMSPTRSFARYSQRFGRMLRTAPGKTHGWYLDPAGNVMRNNGPPDWRVHWTLDAAERRTSQPADWKRCANAACLQVYPRELRVCPHCNEAPPASERRGGPAVVDGDLTEIDPDWLRERAREIARIAAPEPRLPHGLAGPARIAAHKHHTARREAHEALRHACDVWAACQDVPLDQAYRRFYLRFGTDVATALTLGRADAEGLRARVEASIVADGFVI